MAIDNIEEAGQISRGVYQRVLPENPSKDYYYILRETGNVQPLLVEYGFIDNINDSKKLINNLDDYVEGVVKAIADYARVPYTPPTESNGNNNNTDYDTETYTVKKGDTLYAIATKYGITVNELKELNNLTNNEIYIGQVLQLRSSPRNSYIVKRGDTLYSIARQFNVSVEDLKEVNNLITNILYIGQELLIPSEVQDPDNNNNNQPPEIDIPLPDDDIINEEYEIYIVQKGDSLWNISRKFNIPLQDLILINGLDNNTIRVGQELYIPKQENKIYVVQKGDSLWSIAKKFNISVNDLKSANMLTDNLLSIGQQLIIP